jgi:putative transposase
MLSEVGRIVDEEWRRAPLIRPYVNLDAFVIMPNHLHGVIIITDAAVGARRRLAPTNDVDSPRQFGSPPPHAVSSLIGSYKSAATRRVNRFRGSPGAPLWQRNYYEHIIRGDEELQRIRYYIECNPTQWEADRYYPAS